MTSLPSIRDTLEGTAARLRAWQDKRLSSDAGQAAQACQKLVVSWPRAALDYRGLVLPRRGLGGRVKP